MIVRNLLGGVPLILSVCCGPSLAVSKYFLDISQKCLNSKLPCTIYIGSFMTHVSQDERDRFKQIRGKL